MRNISFVCFIILLSLNNINICAAPSDHGRDYVSHSTGLFELIGFVVLIGIVIFYIYGLFYNESSTQGNSSKDNGSRSQKSVIKDKSDNIPLYLRIETCTKCNGRGWNKGKRYYGHICLTCGGSGRLVSSKAESLLKEYKEKKQRKDGEDIRLTVWKAAPIYKEYLRELEKCPPCPDCRELREIEESDIFTDYDNKQYIKVICDKCQGTGKIYS